jgi:hypothetical protein
MIRQQRCHLFVDRLQPCQCIGRRQRNVATSVAAFSVDTTTKRIKLYKRCEEIMVILGDKLMQKQIVPTENLCSNC